jgi:hypothetical protein
MAIISRVAFALLALMVGCSESAPSAEGNAGENGAGHSTSGSGGIGTTTTGSGGAQSNAGGSSTGSSGGASTGGNASGTGGANGAGGSSTGPVISDGGVGAFGGLNFGPVSNGGTITFTGIGAPGWYPSRRDPASNMCDAYNNAGCCMSKLQFTGDQLTPWDQDLIVTLRGPIIVKQFVVYQPSAADASRWQVTSTWDARSAANPHGIAFNGNATAKTPFSTGAIGSQCLVDVSTDQIFPCGAGSSPFCPAPGAGQHKYKGWAGSKMFVILASMPHVGTAEVPDAQNCSNDATNNWHDAPWVGISHGELVRAGAFGSCQCYAKDPTKWYLGDGCGQINAFEVVNDNNAYKNLDVFSTNFFGYQGYIGEGPCGAKCATTSLAPEVDLIDKNKDTEAAKGATSMPGTGPGAAFRRPSTGYRYFVVLLDAPARTVQMGIVHPDRIPAAVAPLLPSLPAEVGQPAIDAVLQLRLPH